MIYINIFIYIFSKKKRKKEKIGDPRDKEILLHLNFPSINMFHFILFILFILLGHSDLIVAILRYIPDPGQGLITTFFYNF